MVDKVEEKWYTREKNGGIYSLKQSKSGICLNHWSLDEKKKKDLSLFILPKNLVCLHLASNSMIIL